MNEDKYEDENEEITANASSLIWFLIQCNTEDNTGELSQAWADVLLL